MRKLLFGGAVAALLLGTAGSAIADESPTGSTEGHEATFDCPAEGEPVPEGQPAPGPDDCQGDDTTYSAWVHDNEVRCAGSSGTPLVDVGAAGDAAAMSGALEVCSDEDSGGPIQGRIIVSGSADDGLTVAVDGDASNPEEGQGWVAVNAGPEPSYRCGDDAGNLDSQTPTADDGPEDCPAP